MGKFVNGEFVDLAIEPIIQRANAITISVNFGIGRSRRVSATEFVIEQTFVNAIRGDVKAHKDIVKWAKKYLRNEKKRRPMTKSRRIHLGYRELFTGVEDRGIHRLGWINSKRLHGDGSLGPCEAPHCGGYIRKICREVG